MIIFGSGTSVTIQTTNEVKPDFYYLEDQDKEDDVCLATSFTRHNAVTSQQDFKGFNETKPTMITEFGGVYNQVAFLKEQEKGKCQALSTSEPCTPKPDPIVNLASLTILGLRVIFFKTVVFNVLMTLRLWSRQ
ncbi:M1-specific T cell receptor alpha chain isoform X5 [Oryzias latipes]